MRRFPKLRGTQLYKIRLELPRDPFWTLVGHFARRILAGEEEGEGGMSLGLGAVLAILASPGAFASIFLLDKYATLMQWLRHRSFNSYQASIADEYFFVVLSMTVTGLVMVLRWNHLFPDRRDFANLAVLPIPIRNVFLANFLALFGLAVLFAIDVNAFSALFFPFIVTISDGHGGSFAKLLLMLRSHAGTVFLSSLFSFFAVFGAVGVLMLVVPKRFFAAVSICVRILLVVALLTEFFANMLLQLFSGHLSSANGYAQLLPGFWFLGIYEELAHLNGRGMEMLAQRAGFALAAAVCISLAAYALCYRRRFVRLAESLDTVGGAQRNHRLRVPHWLLNLFFPARFERACASFVGSVLLRNERHLMFLGGYLGIGLVLTAQTAMDSLNTHIGTALPNPDILAIPLMIAFFVITGLRFVFDMPATLSANWVFRSIVENPSPNPRRAARTILLICVLSWQLGILFPLTCIRFGCRIAALHTATVAILSATLIEFVLARFHKIPFTCSSRPDIRMLMMRILGAVFGLMIIVPAIASIELWMLAYPLRFVYGGVLIAVAWYLILRRRRGATIPDQCITFEDSAPPQFELLKLI